MNQLQQIDCPHQPSNSNHRNQMINNNTLPIDRDEIDEEESKLQCENYQILPKRRGKNNNTQNLETMSWLEHGLTNKSQLQLQTQVARLLYTNNYQSTQAFQSKSTLTLTSTIKREEFDTEVRKITTNVIRALELFINQCYPQLITTYLEQKVIDQHVNRIPKKMQQKDIKVFLKFLSKLYNLFPVQLKLQGLQTLKAYNRILRSILPNPPPQQFTDFQLDRILCHAYIEYKDLTQAYTYLKNFTGQSYNYNYNYNWRQVGRERFREIFDRAIDKVVKEGNEWNYQLQFTRKKIGQIMAVGASNDFRVEVVRFYVDGDSSWKILRRVVEALQIYDGVGTIKYYMSSQAKDKVKVREFYHYLRRENQGCYRRQAQTKIINNKMVRL